MNSPAVFSKNDSGFYQTALHSTLAAVGAAAIPSAGMTPLENAGVIMLQAILDPFAGDLAVILGSNVARSVAHSCDSQPVNVLGEFVVTDNLVQAGC